MKFVLLAAGKSKRLYKKIKKNKCLIKIGKKTLVENTISEIKKTRSKLVQLVL